MRRTHVYMSDGEPLGVGPFFECLLEKNLDDSFSMVVVKKLCEEVLGRRVEKKVFGVYGMKEKCVFQEK
jgi:hypothetical protein